MEVKVATPHVSAAPESPKSESTNTKQDSRGSRIMQYLTRTVSGNGPKESNTHSLRRETRPHNVNDSEESDEDVHPHAHMDQNSSDATRPTLLRKLSHKTQSLRAEEKGPATEGANGWGMSKSVIEVSKGVAADLKGSFGRLFEMKSVLLEKLASMPTVSAEMLEHARHSIESIVSDATHSAYGKTRDAMVRIRVKLIEVIPSLSPHETKKIVDDVEREVLDTEKAKDEVKDGRVGVSASTASAHQPASTLAANMDRLKAWAVLRSRL